MGSVGTVAENGSTYEHLGELVGDSGYPWEGDTDLRPKYPQAEQKVSNVNNLNTRVETFENMSRFTTADMQALNQLRRELESAPSTREIISLLDRVNALLNELRD